MRRTSAGAPMSSLRIPDLAGKVFLVTGASTGIGAAVALALGEQGASVAVHYNASKEPAEKVVAGIEKAGAKAFLVGGDVTTSKGPAAIVEKAAKHFGR